MTLSDNSGKYAPLRWLAPTQGYCTYLFQEGCSPPGPPAGRSAFERSLLWFRGVFFGILGGLGVFGGAFAFHAVLAFFAVLLVLVLQLVAQHRIARVGADAFTTGERRE